MKLTRPASFRYNSLRKCSGCPHKLTICWLVTTQTFKELGLWVSRFFVALTHCSPSMMTFSTCSFASVDRALHWNHQNPTPKFKVKPAGHLRKHGKINVKNVNGHRPETPQKKKHQISITTFLLDTYLYLLASLDEAVLVLRSVRSC